MNESKKQEDQKLNGILLINKPADITSFDVIRKLKKILKRRIKIGHTGTLDDFATGLLIICIGQATKKVPSFMNLNKEYVVTAKLGELTDSLDLTGNTLETQNISIEKKDIETAIKKLGNEYTQIPPVYSALKYQGSPLYKLARNKKMNFEQLEEIVKTKSREVKITKIEITGFSFPFFTIKTTVSKGPYVRSLANDIAQQIGLYATTHKLERTKIGNLKLENAINLDKLNSAQEIENYLLKPDKIEEQL